MPAGLAERVSSRFSDKTLNFKKKFKKYTHSRSWWHSPLDPALGTVHTKHTPEVVVNICLHMPPTCECTNTCTHSYTTHMRRGRKKVQIGASETAQWIKYSLVT